MDQREDECRTLLSDDDSMFSKKFSAVDLHLPPNWIGSTLQGDAKQQFLNIRRQIDLYNVEAVSTENILKILDTIEQIKSGSYKESILVLSAIVHYLRSLLLSGNTDVVFHTVILLDCIVKNSGFILHAMIGRRKFMKTLSLVARRYLTDPSQEHRKVAVYILDCLQAWGEAFYPRQQYYPHIYPTYLKLKTKYKIKFPRPDFDPSRVPIFLGPVSATERAVASRFNAAADAQYGGPSENEEEEQLAAAIASSLASVPVPQERVGYRAMERFKSGQNRMGESRSSTTDEMEECAQLAETLQLSLMNMDLIDLSDEPAGKPSLTTCSSPLTDLFSGTTAMTTPAVTPERTSSMMPLLSPEERILSLFPSTPPVRAVTPFPQLQWPVQQCQAPRRPTATQPHAIEWTAPQPVPDNPFDLFDEARSSQHAAVVTPSPSQSVWSPGPPRTHTRTDRSLWDLEGQLDLPSLADMLSSPQTERKSANAPAPLAAMREEEPPVPSSPLTSADDTAGSIVGTPRKPLGPPPSAPPPPPPGSPLLGPAPPPPPAVPLSPPPPLTPPPPAGEKAGCPAVCPPPIPSFPPPTAPPPPVSSKTDWVPLDTEWVHATPDATVITAQGSPRIPPPPAGRALVRPRSHTASPSSVDKAAAATSAGSLADAIQRTKASLAHVEPRPRTVFTPSVPSPPFSKLSKGVEDKFPAERFDPTAGTRPVPVPKRPPPQKKPAYTPPSSDPNAQILYYGHQRVVVRRPSNGSGPSNGNGNGKGNGFGNGIAGGNGTGNGNA